MVQEQLDKPILEHKPADVMLRCGLIEYRNNKNY
jgi:hypothetical protein